MRTAMIRLVFSALCWLAVLAGPLKQEWIELSHPFNNDTIYWPTSLKFKHTEVFKGFTDDGYYYSAYDISGGEHGGTHLDAPNHFAEGKWTTDEIPIDRLTGRAIKIDISSKAAQVNETTCKAVEIIYSNINFRKDEVFWDIHKDRTGFKMKYFNYSNFAGG